MATVKIVLVGDHGVGKHKFCSRFLTAQFEKRCLTGQSATVYPVPLTTQFGTTRFNVHVADDSQNSHNIRDEFYARANAAIIMFAVNSRGSYRNVPNWYRDVVRVCDNIPMVLVGNKVDAPDRQVKPKMITFHRRKNLQYYEVSSNANYNIEKPFLWLARRLTNNPELQVVEVPALAPPEVIINVAQQSENERQLEMANNATRVMDDDDDGM